MNSWRSLVTFSFASRRSNITRRRASSCPRRCIHMRPVSLVSFPRAVSVSARVTMAEKSLSSSPRRSRASRIWSAGDSGVKAPLAAAAGALAGAFCAGGSADGVGCCWADAQPTQIPRTSQLPMIFRMHSSFALSDTLARRTLEKVQQLREVAHRRPRLVVERPQLPVADPDGPDARRDARVHVVVAVADHPRVVARHAEPLARHQQRRRVGLVLAVDALARDEHVE